LLAEQQAEQIIAEAKKERLAKLKKAKDKAEEDLKVFKEEQEAKFQKETSSKVASDPHSELQDSTKQQIGMVQKDYDTNKSKTIQYVVGKIMEVSIALTDTQKQALRTGMA